METIQEFIKVVEYCWDSPITVTACHNFWAYAHLGAIFSALVIAALVVITILYPDWEFRTIWTRVEGGASIAPPTSTSGMRLSNKQLEVDVWKLELEAKVRKAIVDFKANNPQK